jgi:hypothetical protein
MGMGMVAGSLLGAGVAGGLLRGPLTTGEAIALSGIMGLINMLMSESLVGAIIKLSLIAKYKDDNLARMIKYPHLYQGLPAFKNAVVKKIFYL